VVETIHLVVVQHTEKNCNACNKLNHFAKLCRSKPATEKKINKVYEAEMQDQHDSDSSSDNFLFALLKPTKKQMNG
jgi:hypothetical protein